MTDGVEMATNTKGGLMKGLGRMLSGESLFMATYRAARAGAVIAFASTVAGRILPVDVSVNDGLICQKGAFLCAQDSVNLSVTFTKRFSAGIFGYYIYQEVFCRAFRRRGIYSAGYPWMRHGLPGD